MARIRTIKPDFWTDETLGECSPTARLLFIATWNFADDYGNLERSSKQLKAQAFPYDVIDCEPMVRELLAHGLLSEYEVGGKKYLHINGFERHQKVEKQSKAKHPHYDPSATPPRVVGEESPSSSGSSSSLRKGREGSTPEKKPTKPKIGKHPIPEDFDLTPDRKAYAEKHLPNVDSVALMETFRSTSKAKGWEYADWDQHWQTLVRQWAPDSGHWSSCQFPKQQGGVRW